MSAKKPVGGALQDHHIADLLARGLNLKKKNGQHYLVTKTVTAPRRIHEQDDDIAMLTMILPGEKFECNLKAECILGDCKEAKLGTKKMEYNRRQWHEKCFICMECRTPIGTKSFVPKEDDIYCAPCYEEKFSARCVKCTKAIKCGGVSYNNESWHRECFVCAHCNRQLAGKRFTTKEEKPYCGDCYGQIFAKKCFACTKPITGIGGTRYISFEQHYWHNDCFKCHYCKKSMVGKGFIADDDDVVCPACAKERMI